MSDEKGTQDKVLKKENPSDNEPGQSLTSKLPPIGRIITEGARSSSKKDKKK